MGSDYRDHDKRDDASVPWDDDRSEDRKDHPIGPVRAEIATRVNKVAVDDLKGFAKVGFLDVEKFVRLKGRRLFIEKKLPFALVVLSQERWKKDHDKKPVIVASKLDLPVEVQENSSEDLTTTSVVGFVDVEKIIRIDDEDILIEKKLPFHILILRQRDDKKKDGHRCDGDEHDKDRRKDDREDGRRTYSGDR